MLKEKFELKPAETLPDREDGKEKEKTMEKALSSIDNVAGRIAKFYEKI